LDLFLKNIHLISPLDKLDIKTDLCIKDGVINGIGKIESESKTTNLINAEDITCVPGFFDMHVHFRAPGQVHKEDMYSGSLSAVNGGFTGVLTMPNTIPPVDSKKVIEYILNKERITTLDVYASSCLTKKRLGRELVDFKSMNKYGAAAFTDDGSVVQNPDLMNKAMEQLNELGSIIAQHCEDMYLSGGGCMNKGTVSRKLNYKGIPNISESSIIARDLMFLQSYRNLHYHIQHVSASDSIKLIRRAKEHLNNISCEVCPHHFILTDEDCLKYSTNAKMNPPLRTAKDVSELKKALKGNVIDIISSDHAPHNENEKSVTFEQAPFGIVGLESSIALSYTYLVKENVISFEDLIYKMSINPRKLLGLEQNKIKVNEKANLTLLKTKETWTINSNKFKSKSKNTPFDGFAVICKPFAVINNNQIYFSEL